MRTAIALLLLGALWLPRALAAPAEQVALIIPGSAIGLARLGMTEPELSAVNGRSACPVTAAYRRGRAVRLATVWGVACQTAGGSSVGLGFSRVKAEYGEPDKVRHDTTYPNSFAVWIDYYRPGIAFRVLTVPGDRATLVTAIAVFPAGDREAALMDGSSPTAVR